MNRDIRNAVGSIPTWPTKRGVPDSGYPSFSLDRFFHYDYIIGWLYDIDIDLHIRIDLHICIEKHTDFLRCPSLHAIGHMGIGIQRKSGTVMAKHTRNRFDICSTLDS